MCGCFYYVIFHIIVQNMNIVLIIWHLIEILNQFKKGCVSKPFTCHGIKIDFTRTFAVQAYEILKYMGNYSRTITDIYLFMTNSFGFPYYSLYIIHHSVNEHIYFLWILCLKIYYRICLCLIIFIHLYSQALRFWLRIGNFYCI